MDNKTIDVPTAHEGRKARSFAYFREMKEELKRVSWTTPAELSLGTKIVVAVTFLFGLGTYFVDLLIKGVLNGIGTLAHLIFG